MFFYKQVMSLFFDFSWIWAVLFFELTASAGLMEPPQDTDQAQEAQSQRDSFFCRSNGDLESKIFETLSLEDLRSLKLTSRLSNHFLSEPSVARKIRLTRMDTFDQVPLISSTDYFNIKLKIEKDDGSVQLLPNQNSYLSNALRIRFDHLSDFIELMSDPQSGDYSCIEFDFSDLPAGRFFSEEELKKNSNVLRNWSRLREVSVIFNSNQSFFIHQLTTDLENLTRIFQKINSLTVEIRTPVNADDSSSELNSVQRISKDFDRLFFIRLDEFYFILRNIDLGQEEERVYIVDGFARKKSSHSPFDQDLVRKKIEAFPDAWRTHVYNSRLQGQLGQFFEYRTFRCFDDVPIENSPILKKMKRMNNVEFSEVIEYQFDEFSHIEATGSKKVQAHENESREFSHEIFQAEEILKKSKVDLGP